MSKIYLKKKTHREIRKNRTAEFWKYTSKFWDVHLLWVRSVVDSEWTSIMCCWRLLVSTVFCGWHCSLTGSVTARQMPTGIVIQANNLLVVTAKPQTPGSSRFCSSAARATLIVFVWPGLSENPSKKNKKNTREVKKTQQKALRDRSSDLGLKHFWNNQHNCGDLSDEREWKESSHCFVEPSLHRWQFSFSKAKITGCKIHQEYLRNKLWKHFSHISKHETFLRPKRHESQPRCNLSGSLGSWKWSLRNVPRLTFRS